ncbi:hypothetical protein ACFTWD_31625 [Streptomyces sp. NPDC056943]|uniref:hypothetical protein n=1 Tax=Streptomyces sp. NPDC056943 TaxID=3345971 RepID=UPI00363DA10F
MVVIGVIVEISEEHNMRKCIGRTLIAATAVAAALVVSGCSASQDAAPKVAGDDGSGSGKPQDDAAIKQSWVSCMHAQGQTQVLLDKEGNISVPAAGTGSAPVGGYDAAAKVCDGKNPGIHQVQKKNDKKFVDMARAFVACGRKNGYPDMPDPDPKDGILVFTAQQFDAAKWDAIQPACSKLPMPGYRIGS